MGDYAVDWQIALDQTAPVALGRDVDGVLAWQTELVADWTQAIQLLGQIRKDLCQKAGDLRPLLSHPVTKRQAAGWGKNERVPNTLRFKVIPDGGKVRGLVFHMPCRPSDELWKQLREYDRDDLVHLWGTVHQHLDQTLERVNEP